MSSPEKTLNVGIIGLGVGEKHIPNFNAHPRARVTALCDVSEEKQALARERYPGVRVTGEADELLLAPDIDVVSIASYDDDHFSQAQAAMLQGKHVFVEKPLCLYRDEAVRLRDLLRKNPALRLSSNLNLRTCPRFLRMKYAIDSGETGRLFALEGDYLWGRVEKLTQGWRGRMPFYSIVYGAAVHMIDLLMWLKGERPVEVQGYGNGIATAGSGFRFHDAASLLLRFEDNLLARVAAYSGCVHPHFHRVAVFGTRKTFLHEMGGGKALTSSDPEAPIETLTEAYPGIEEKGKVITSFLDSILDSQAAPVVSADDVLDTMSVCFAAERAVQTGQPVRIEYI